MVLFLICALSSVEAVEWESNMLALQNTMVKNRRAKGCKAFLSGAYGGIFGMILWSAFAVEIHMEYGLTGMSSPAGSVELLGLSSGTVGISLLMYGLWAGTAGTLSGLGIRQLSRSCGNTRHTALWSALLMEFPLFLLLMYGFRR